MYRKNKSFNRFDRHENCHKEKATVKLLFTTVIPFINERKKSEKRNPSDPVFAQSQRRKKKSFRIKY